MNDSISKLDREDCSKDKRIISILQPGEKIRLSSKVMKYNHNNKQQERILVITDRHIINIIPPSLFGNLFSKVLSSVRIKRKIDIAKVYGVTVSRFGFEFTIHVPDEYDYRFSSIDFRDKILYILCQSFCNYHQRKMPFYFKDDMILVAYTTTKIDLDKKITRIPTSDPELMDPVTLSNPDKHQATVEVIFQKTMSKSNSISESQFKSSISIEDFQVVKVLGRGAFGKVMLCEHKQTGKVYAIKSLNKENLINKDQIQHTKTEREILITIQHPFLVSLQYAFQTKEKLFFVMPFVRGGEMFHHLKNYRRFPEKWAKFYAAQLVLGIGYLHSLSYIYRDLKPENILMDEFGYIQLTDFGLAKKLDKEKGQQAYSFVGTPDYLAPEIIKADGHNHMVDWWSLGVLMQVYFEMIVGLPPFYHENQNLMFKQIMEKEIKFPNSIAMSPEVKDIITLLLRKNQNQRLGAINDVEEIKSHNWFNDMNFDELINKKIDAPFKPKLKDNFDVSNFDEEFTEEVPINSVVQGNNKLLQQYDSEFVGMTFVQDNLAQNE